MALFVIPSAFRLDHAVPVEGLYAEPGSLHLLSHSGRLVKGWRVQQLYRQSTVIGSHTHFLQRTTHPKVSKPSVQKHWETGIGTLPHYHITTCEF